MKKLFLVIIAVLFITSVSYAEEKEEIKVGLISALSGNIATYGMTTMNGMKLAIEQANENGGINGRMIKLLIQDNKGKSDESITIANRFIHVDKVVAILGPVISTNCLAVAPIAQEEKVPMLTATGTNIEITKEGEYISRTCFIDQFQGEAIATFAAKNLNVETAVILTDIGSDYSLGLGSSFKRTFESYGKKVLDEIGYDVQNDVDYNSHMIKVKELNPDVVFIPGYSEVAPIVKQARSLGIKSVFLGGDGWDTQDVLDNGGEALEGSFITTHFSKENQAEIVQNFLRDYRARFNEEPSVLSALGYDAGLVFINALKNAKSISREDIKDAINATKDLQGVTGKITLDKDRNPIKQAHILEAKGGKYILKTEVMPTSKEDKMGEKNGENIQETPKKEEEGSQQQSKIKQYSLVIIIAGVLILLVLLFSKRDKYTKYK